MSPPRVILSDPTPYPTVHVPRDASEKTEYVGTKEKFWFSRYPPGLPRTPENEERWLFKVVRVREKGPLSGTYPDGDDWAERVVADVAGLLGLPHADYELAVHDAESGLRPGIVTPQLRGPGRLVEGNELIVRHARVEEYPEVTEPGFTTVPGYTVALVIDVLSALGVEPWPTPDLPPEVKDGADLLVGYLLLDALVWNTDRHDQNWAVFERHGRVPLLAPTYDHASSLGRELPDTKREARLQATTAPHDLASYLAKPTSRFHDPSGRRLHPLGAFEHAARLRPAAAAAWLRRLSRVPTPAVARLLARVPDTRITTAGREFAARLVDSNRAALARLSLP